MRIRNKLKTRIYNRQWLNRLKVDVLSHYSNDGLCCALCSEARLACLTIDHIDGGGLKHRQSIGYGGTNFYRWLQREGYPKGFQTLCMNCQLVKYHTEKCKAIEKLIDDKQKD